MKKFIWITPLVGIIYLLVCGINNQHWFIKAQSKNYHYFFIGLMIQIISIVLSMILISKL